MAEAELYRRTELPFVVRGHPGFSPAVEKWAREEYAATAMDTYQKVGGWLWVAD